MKNKEQTKNTIKHFIETFNKNIGKTLYFKEAISTQKENFDRHFTSFSSTEFLLTNFTARISGARIMFDGEKLNYEISLDRVISLEESECQFIFIEAYSEDVYRQTILKVIN